MNKETGEILINLNGQNEIIKFDFAAIASLDDTERDGIQRLVTYYAKTTFSETIDILGAGIKGYNKLKAKQVLTFENFQEIRDKLQEAIFAAFQDMADAGIYQSNPIQSLKDLREEQEKKLNGVN